MELEPKPATSPYYLIKYRLIYRPKNKQPTKLSELSCRALKFNFIEAKATWKSPESKADDYENNLDISTNEEEAALLAGPMINKAIENYKTDQTTRNLHHKQGPD
ncbi:hypothetical protein GGI26_005747 [Coemansia sp. RSA 1358]|nr:hypothetical protein GGI26_005747 [Coemansia sp. RSA 1358]